MAREKLENGGNHSNSLINTLGIASILCMFCIVFLGLKLKWFRAQIKFGDSQIDKKRGQPVEGVGFKLRTNTEDYQSYKIISEFSSITESPQYPSTNSKFGITSQHQRTNKMTKSDSIPNINAASNANITKKSPALPSKSKSSSNLTQNIKENISKNNIKQAGSNDIDSKQITASNSKKPQNSPKEPTIAQTRSKPSQKTKAPKLFEAIKLKEANPPKKQSDMFDTNLNIKNNRTETDVISNITFDNYDEVESPIQIRKPLENTYKKPTKFEEENWDINFVDEKPKEKLFIDLETEADDSYFAPSASSMYSSQATSIFFGGPPPVVPRSPARKLITYDSDNESVGSQTSA